MTTVVLISNLETTEIGSKTLITSHGINMETMETVTVPNVHPMELGAVFDKDLCEWVLC